MKTCKKKSEEIAEEIEMATGVSDSDNSEAAAAPSPPEDHDEHAGGLSPWREFCHFDDTPCLSLLKHLMKLQGGGAIK